MPLKTLIASCFVVLSASNLSAQGPLAANPPMGWNSWDSYGLTITEAQFGVNVDVLSSRLKPFGWKYVVIDEGWYLKNPSAQKPEEFQYTLNERGQYSPALNRFPSADKGAGLKLVGDSVHAKGLLFGIHIIRGIPKETVHSNSVMIAGGFHPADAADTTDTCSWNSDNFGVRDNAAGQAWYDGLIRQYASWGVDYLKVDCIASHPYKADEIRMIHRAIVKSGRPIVLSLSPGPTALENAAEVGQNAQLWRISDDVWDYWDRPAGKEFPKPLKRQFATIASWAKYTKPGNWPDADMLPLGELRPVPGYEAPRTSRLTHVEQQTMLTLWSISRSPLFMGGNLTMLDEATAALLTNAEVLAVDQHGHDQRVAMQDGDLIAWTSKGVGDRQYLALFNLGDSAATVNTSFDRYGLAGTSYKLRDLWAKKDLGQAKGIAQSLPAHGSMLLELRP
ncbi:glycoside hydrolase family 27 protein [Granulicella arctica]|uniref:glycoside hydrolase family 27 protein n=1 Tax=Granulicella arctica TaxID=940613 RepID=UPI0021E09869|nr:glycoside hydrolase family 27 protein [Granulicella arctica]